MIRTTALARRLRWTTLAALAAVALVAGTALAATQPTSHARQRAAQAAATTPRGIAAQLRKVKAALSKYESVTAAEADGYARASACEAIPTSPGASWWSGAMGIHYVNNALTRLPVNPMKPAILTYLPTPNGGLQLGAAEYFKADADQNLKTDGDRPTIFGRAFDGPMLGHAPGMPIHYDLHVWLWKHNPSGMFAPWNPAASC